jgi:hypothetical protein
VREHPEAVTLRQRLEDQFYSQESELEVLSTQRSSTNSTDSDQDEEGEARRGNTDDEVRLNLDKRVYVSSTIDHKDQPFDLERKI